MMNRDVIRKGHAKRRQRKRWLVLSLVVLLIAAMSATGFIAIKRHWIDLAKWSNKVTAGKEWLVERKSHLKEKLATNVDKVKRIAAHQDEADTEIHFEFYTALQNMQVANAEKVVGQELPAPKKVSHEVIQKPDHEQTDEKPQTASNNKIFMDPTELEKEFSAHLQRESYVVQVGVFSSREAADAYRNNLQTYGFPIDVIKMAGSNKASYRVQVGPFLNRDKAIAAQTQLEKKGINAILRENAGV